MKKFISFLVAIAGMTCFQHATGGEIRTKETKTTLEIAADGYAGISFRSSVATVQFREVMTQRGTFTELFIPGHFKAPVIGNPDLPSSCRLLEVPFNQGFEIEIQQAEYVDYDLVSHGILHRIMPVQPSLSKGVTDPSSVAFVINDAVYAENRFTGQPLVVVEPSGTLRSVNLARLVISPVQYNPVTKTLRIYSVITASVKYLNPDVKATNQLRIKYNSDSLITTSPATYVMVSPPDFREALQPLVKWKTRKGFRVIQAYTNDPAVGTTTSSIKGYLQNLYTSPPPGYNPPDFVLFVGDVAQIPAWMNNGQATDLRYCEYTGDNLPEVFYGRFSASNLTQLQPYIDKVLEYEQYLFPDDTFLNEVVMIAGYDAGGAGLTFGNGQINYGTTYYFNTAHNLLSHTYLQPEPSGANYSQQIRGNISDGVCYANYTAHGSESGWANPEFVISQIPALENDHKYSLMVGNCCLTSRYNVNCFAEEITRAANKGAIGYIGGSNNSYWDEDFWWGCGLKAVSTAPVYDPEHPGAYDLTFHDHGEPASEWFTTMAQMMVAGNLAVEQSNSSLKEYYWEIYNLMGDPSLNIYYSVPAPLIATLPPIMLIGTNTCTVSAEPWSYVALSLNDSTLLDARCADSNGQVILQYNTLDLPGYARFVITKQNRKPLIDSVLIIQPTGPYITLGTVSVNDSAGGNNNGMADYDETVSLHMVISNVGASATSGLVATIATADTNVVIQNNTCVIGTVVSGMPNIVNDAFTIKVKNNVADQHTVIFNIVFTEGTSSWNGTYSCTLNAPLMTIGNITILDQSPGGNNNGILDPGETAMIGVLLKNTGHSPVTNTSATLGILPGSTGYILLNNTSAFVGAIPVNSSKNAWFQAVTNGITPPGTAVGFDLAVDAGQYNQYHASGELSLVIGEPAVFPMGNTTISACSGVFYDPGGPDANYPNNQDLAMTIHAGSPGAKLRAIFTSFSLEPQPDCTYDYLNIYNGPSMMDPLIGSYCGDQLPDTITSTSSVGSLTFFFHSDYQHNFPGWSATLKCMGGPLSLLANSFPASVCEGGSSQLVAIVNGGSGNCTYQWSPATYLNDPTSATPIATPEANITYTVTVSDGTGTLSSGPVSLNILPRPPAPAITLNGAQLISSLAEGNQWYINGNLIPDATDQTYSPASSGDYTATVTSQPDFCESEPSNYITWLITATGEPQASNQVTVYPNPAREHVIISVPSPEAGQITVSISDATGRVLSTLMHPVTLPTAHCHLTLSTGHLSAGVYYCTIRTSQRTTVKKIIITKQ